MLPLGSNDMDIGDILGLNNILPDMQSPDRWQAIIGPISRGISAERLGLNR